VPAVVFRMSCIYGPHQFGTEDQGWVAHFLIQALKRKPLTLYGDGLQVRDILFVDDLVEAMLLAHRHINRTAGEAFNIGGGPARTVSLLELLNLIGQLTGERPDVTIEPWRPADQRYYVSDTAKFEQVTGWRPKTSVRKGVGLLLGWLMQQESAGAREVVGGRVAS
jgi:CDP-paratose 2-epimerase